MVPVKKRTYGIIVILIAVLIMTSASSAYFYLQYNREEAAKNEYVKELQAADLKYIEISADYNRLISQYNKSISLLIQSISVLNTSLPIYQEASKQIAQLWNTYLESRPAQTSLIRASVFIDFGNGTTRWFNSTQMHPGWNLYQATLVIMKGNVDAQWYPQYGAHFVTGIGNVRNTQNAFWFLWTYEQSASWQTAQVGADQLLMHDRSVYAWTFCKVDASFQPMCRP
jgi:hypothetical protein